MSILSDEQIKAALDTVWGKNQGKRISLPTLASMVLRELKATPDSFMRDEPKVTDYIKEHCVVIPGKHGGIEQGPQ